ncbi:MAG: hypothetical protein KBS83_05260 [Lachnospiraceae bacterium]|nr:hypothetical protein [Candidatus Equihabitans merdae]
MTAVFDKEYYDLDELSENLNLLVDDYNDTIDGFQIEVTSITKSEDNMVEVDMYYRTDEDYAAFNNVVFNETLLSKALADGSINGDVTLAGLGESGISSVADIAASKTRYHVLIYNEPISVKVPGKVAYMSDSLHMDEDGWISLKEIPEGSIVLPANLYIIYK